MKILQKCSKKDLDGTKKLIEGVNEELKLKTGFPIMNNCTDGDGTRRIASNQLMTHKANEYD